MKIFSATQLKKWDAYTIAHEPIAAIDLMERAATLCVNWLETNQFLQKNILLFCGKGNNGGDGLAIARLLVQQKIKVSIYLIGSDKEGTAEFKTNLKKLETSTFNIYSISSTEKFPEISPEAVVIDALFGTGLNKPLTDLNASLINHINNSGAAIIAIDIPSGLFADVSSTTNTVIKATHTLTFQQYKLAFLVAENEKYYGNVHALNIGLHKQFEIEEESIFNLTDRSLIKSIYKKRKKFSHKGTYGHAALIAGSYGMMGAAVLSAKACLRSGAGKLTCFIPECGYTIMQIALPEAMCRVNGIKYIESVTDIDTFNAIGIGPGMGLQPSHVELLKSIFQSTKKPLLIDADALNILSEHNDLLKLIPALSIITPHPKEFERLFGKVNNDFERLSLALQKSKEFNIYIALKGHNSFISCPDGKGYFNSTGNAGMATAGSGDVLSGIITGLLAQSYPSLETCLLSVYLHGLAGDIAAEKLSEEALLASDIICNLGLAFNQLNT